MHVAHTLPVMPIIMDIGKLNMIPPIGIVQHVLGIQRVMEGGVGFLHAFQMMGITYLFQEKLQSFVL